MATISYARHQFPPDVIRHAVWLYLRFTVSYRDVEEMLAERGLDLTYETVRRWVTKFGPLFARELRKRRPPDFGLNWMIRGAIAVIPPKSDRKEKIPATSTPIGGAISSRTFFALSKRSAESRRVTTRLT